MGIRSNFWVPLITYLLGFYSLFSFTVCFYSVSISLVGTFSLMSALVYLIRFLFFWGEHICGVATFFSMTSLLLFICSEVLLRSCDVLYCEPSCIELVDSQNYSKPSHSFSTSSFCYSYPPFICILCIIIYKITSLSIWRKLTQEPPLEKYLRWFKQCLSKKIGLNFLEIYIDY